MCEREPGTKSHGSHQATEWETAHSPVRVTAESCPREMVAVWKKFTGVFGDRKISFSKEGSVAGKMCQLLKEVLGLMRAIRTMESEL